MGLHFVWDDMKELLWWEMFTRIPYIVFLFNSFVRLLDHPVLLFFLLAFKCLACCFVKVYTGFKKHAGGNHLETIDINI